MEDKSQLIQDMVKAYEAKYQKGILSFMLPGYVSAAFGVKVETAKDKISNAVKNQYIRLEEGAYYANKLR